MQIPNGAGASDRNNILIEILLWIPYVILFLFDRKFRQSFERLTWHRSKLEAMQLQQMQEAVAYAYEHSPMYRQLYDAAGVHPRDIVTLADIEKLPILTKAQLRAGIDNGSIFTTPKRPFGVSKTSTAGSSGDPLVLHYDLPSRKNRYRNSERMFWMIGVFPPTRLGHIWRKKSGHARVWLRTKLGVFKKINVIDVMHADQSAVGRDTLGAIVDELRAFNPEALRGYTSSLWVIAQYVRKHGIPFHPGRVITSAEYVPAVWQQEMEKIFRCPVHNLYGGTEASPIAVSLSEGPELVAFEDFYYTEIVDRNHQAVEIGVPGRVILSDYASRYMPLIRYEIGDIAAWSGKQVGPLRMFSEVHGRINDIFVLPGGRLLFSHNWHIHFREVPSIVKCKIIQRSIDRIDITLEVQDPKRGWSDDLLAAKHEVHQAVGSDVAIHWELTDRLELDAGEKFRTVRSEVDQSTIINYL